MAPKIFLNAALADTNQFWEVFMLKKWTTHSDYLSHMNREIDLLSPHEKNRLFKLHQNSLLKLSLLNLDSLLPVVKPLYPELGRPAKNQCEMLRSLILMVDVRKQSITDWAMDTTHDPVLYLSSESWEISKSKIHYV